MYTMYVCTLPTIIEVLAMNNCSFQSLYHIATCSSAHKFAIVFVINIVTK